MAENVGGAVYTLDLDDRQYRSKLTRAESDFRSTAGRMDRIGQDFTRAGRALSIGITAPLVGAGIAATKFSMDFETTLSRITGLVGDNAEQVRAWGDELLELGPRVAKGPRELAEALYFVRSSGIDASKSLSVVEASAKAAAAGLGDTATVAQALTSAMNAYGIENLSAEQAASILVATVREGKAEADDLAGSIGRVIPIAAQLGVSFDQVGAALAAMTLFGLDTEESATALRGVFATLLKPAQQAKDVLAAAGLSAEGLRRQLREEGLLSVLQTLSTAFAGNEDALAAVIPNIRALTGFLSLAGKNADQVEGIFKSLANTTEQDLNRAFDAAADTAGFKVRAAFVRLQADMIRFGDAIAPALDDALPAFEGLISVLERGLALFEELSPEVRTSIVAIAALVAAIGPLTFAIGGMVGGIAAVIAAAPVMAAALGFLVVGGALVVGAAAVAAALGLINGRMLELGINSQTASQAAINFKRQWLDAIIPILEGLRGIIVALQSFDVVLPGDPFKNAARTVREIRNDLFLAREELDAITGRRAIAEQLIGAARLNPALQLPAGHPVRVRAELQLIGQLDELGLSIDEAGGSARGAVPYIDDTAGSLGGLGDAAGGATTAADALSDGIIDLAEAIALGLSDQEVVTLELAAAQAEADKQAFRLRIGLLALARQFPGLHAEGIRWALALWAIQRRLAETGRTIEQFIRDTAATQLDAARSLAQQILGGPTRESLELDLRMAQLRRRRALILQGGDEDDPRIKAIDREIDALQNVIDLRQSEIDILRIQAQLADQTLDTDRDLINATIFLTAVIGNLSIAANDAVAAMHDLAGIGTSVPSFQHGTDYVPRTMLARLHEGERVVTAAENRQLAAGRPAPLFEGHWTITAADERAIRRQAMRQLDEGLARARRVGSMGSTGTFRD